jgi:glutaredoxin 3
MHHYQQCIKFSLKAAILLCQGVWNPALSISIPSSTFIAQEVKSMFTLYTTKSCPYCHRAKALLDSKRLPYVEFDLTNDPDGRGALVLKAAGRTSVPQIFLGDQHLGGCDDLHQLDASGELDRLVKSYLSKSS